MNETLISDIRSILSEAPSQDLMRQLVAELILEQDNPDFEVALDYTERHLAGWPKGLRWPCYDCINMLVPHSGYAKSFESPLYRLFDYLDLSYKDLSMADVIALANSPHMSNLETLKLDSCFVGDEGLKAIANSPHLSNLKELNLGTSEIGGDTDSIVALANSPHMTNLVTLLLLGNQRVGTSGVEALVNGTSMGKLERLSLSGCGVDSKGATMLTTPGSLPSLNHLNLQLNQIGNLGIFAISESPEMAKLYHLDLAGNGDPHARRRIFAASPYLQESVKIHSRES